MIRTKVVTLSDDIVHTAGLVQTGLSREAWIGVMDCDQIFSYEREMHDIRHAKDVFEERPVTCLTCLTRHP